jgi:AcrR family transcriptional regulator
MRKAPAPAPPPPPGRREQNKLDKRERIQRAGWELFTGIGYDDTTTRAVADRADVAVGTLFRYATGKRDLLCLVMHDELAALTDARFATMPSSTSLLNQLMHLFHGLFSMYLDHPELAAAFVRNFPGADGPNGRALMALTVTAVSRIAELVVRKQELGEVAADVDAFQAATNFFSLYFGVLIGWISGFTTDPGALDGTLRAALELQIRGLRPHA